MSVDQGDPAATTARGSTTPTQIVDAALEIIDSEGFAALSMRRLASRLGVFPTSLYWHVGNRGQLLGMVCERVLSAIELPPVDLAWRDWLFAFGLRTRAVIGGHPRFAGYFVTNIQASASSLRLAEAVLSTLDRAGFAGGAQVRAYNAVMGAVFGWISGEFASADLEDDDTRSTLESLALETEDFPHIRAVWPLAGNRAYMLRWDSGTTAPLESSFEEMLGALLHGLARALPASR